MLSKYIELFVPEKKRNIANPQILLEHLVHIERENCCTHTHTHIHT